MDRDRVAAWVASLPVDDPHRPIAAELLAGYDAALDKAATASAALQQAHEARQTAEVRLAATKEDAARLAGWIVANHQTGGDPAEVLTLHDRT